MQNWVPFFIVVTALAVIVQMAILLALYLQMRRTMNQMNRLLNELQSRVGPILTRVQILLDDTQPRISAMVADAAHVVYIARSQAQKVDRVFTDAADRLRVQLNSADRILTGALEAVEDAGSNFRRHLWGPMHKASAVIQGIKVGLDFLRSHRRRSEPAGTERQEQDDELFI